MTFVAGVIDASMIRFASPLVSIQIPSERLMTRVTRWVKMLLRPSPERRLTMSPTAIWSGLTGSMTTAAPSAISGSIDAPPMMSVSRPVNGTSLPSAAPARATTISPMSAASRIQRTMRYGFWCRCATAAIGAGVMPMGACLSGGEGPHRAGDPSAATQPDEVIQASRGERAQPEGYGLFEVCSAVKVNVVVVVAP